MRVREGDAGRVLQDHAVAGDVDEESARGKSKAYKKTDRDGLYVLVTPTGGIAFRYDYRFNGRRETVTFGSYGPSGLSLGEAREKLREAKRLSPRAFHRRWTSNA